MHFHQIFGVYKGEATNCINVKPGTAVDSRFAMLFCIKCYLHVYRNVVYGLKTGNDKVCKAV